MGVTVTELIAMPHLRTTCRAGAEGGSRLVVWAHSCELAAPWEWLGAGDLLMTNGFAIPPEPAAQAEFIERLDAAGLAGIAIGQGLHAPPLSPELLEAAEARAFPVLETAYEVPFVAVARAVTLANQSAEHSRLVDAIRVYDTMRAATIAAKPAAELIGALASELRCLLHVLDARGLPLFDGAAPAPAALADRVAAAALERGGLLPSVLRLADDERGVALLVPVPSGRFAAMLVCAGPGRMPDLAVVQHVATVAALEVERLSAYREEHRRLGSELLAHLVDHRIDPEVAHAGLQRHGFGDGELIIVASRSDVPFLGDLHHRLADHRLSHLLLRRNDTLLTLLPAQDSALEALRDALGPGQRLGLSDRFTAVRRAGDAAREAQWALTVAHSDAAPVARYGESTPLFLPRTLGEARIVVAKVLGELLAYDEQHATEFVASLRIFLECNRSWQRACARLHVHKQTLVYRMQRVEQLTGRRLRETGDVAELWLALQALEATGGAEAATPPPGSSERMSGAA